MLSSGCGALSPLAKVKYASGPSALILPPFIMAKRKARPPASASKEAIMLLERLSLLKSRAIGAAIPPRRVPPTKSGAIPLEKSGLLHLLILTREAAMSAASMTMIAFSARWSVCRVFFWPEFVRWSTRESQESAVESPEARNVGPMNSQLRAHRGTEVAEIRLPVLEPTLSPTGIARIERKRAGMSFASLTRGLPSPSRPSSAAWRAAISPLRVPKAKTDQLWVDIGERSLRMRSML